MVSTQQFYSEVTSGHGHHSVMARVLALGHEYHRPAVQTVHSLLEKTPFDVVISTDSPDFYAIDYRNRLRIDARRPETVERPGRFVQKITGVVNIPDLLRYDKVLLLDADAVVAAPINARDVEESLSDADFALVEQKTIRGSSMNRQKFFEHFCRFALPAISPLSVPSDFPRFRYWNSGVVLARTKPLIELAAFVEGTFRERGGFHSPEGELVGDQDYFQYWLGHEAGPRFRELPIEWNDCYWWNPEFPSPQSRIIHFSSFTEPPDEGILREMAAARSTSELQFLVVSYNSAGSLNGCLRSIPTRNEPPIVFDNASTDSSRTIANEAGARVYESSWNRGFGKAVNYLVDVASSEFVCVVTPDSRVSEEFVRASMKILREDSNALAVVPQYIEADGSRSEGVRPGYTFRQLTWEILFPKWRSDRAGKAMRWLLGLGTSGWTWPCCACVVFRRDSFLEFGGFDPDFFLYMEDVELGLRASKVGWRIVESNHAVEHAVSTGSEVSSIRRQELLTRARLKFARKGFGKVPGKVAHVVGKLRWTP